MKIPGWKISLWGVKIFFVITIFFFLYFLYFWIDIGRASESTNIMGILSVISFVIGIILYISTKLMKNEKYKRVGGIFIFLVGIIFLIIGIFLMTNNYSNITNIQEVFNLLLRLLLLVSSALLFCGGLLSFIEEKVEESKYNRLILYILSLTLLIIFLPDVLIILMGIKFDENPEVKECQYNYRGFIIIENIISYFGKDISYEIDANCYNKVARKNLDVELCKKLPIQGPGYVNRNDCLSYIALEKNDPLICLDMIEDSFHYSRCVNSISKKYNNHNVCDDINLPEFSTCEEREIKAKCYLEVAGIEKDINICNKDEEPFNK